VLTGSNLRFEQLTALATGPADAERRGRRDLSTAGSHRRIDSARRGSQTQGGHTVAGQTTRTTGTGYEHRSRRVCDETSDQRSSSLAPAVVLGPSHTTCQRRCCRGHS
jgi:hypothetical protein